MDLSQINWLAVVVATIAHMLLGFLWYSLLFGKLWMELRGLKKEEIGNVSPTIYVIPMLLGFVSALLLAIFLQLTAAASLSDALLIALLASLLVITKIGTNYVFENSKLGLFFITVGYHTASLLLMSVILFIWS
jgi:hypothetical protein